MNIVKIPEPLLEKLKPFGPRFIKVEKPTSGDDKSGKRAVEHAWQEHPYEADDPEMQSWLEAGGNYGVVCGQGIIEIDIDKEETRERFEIVKIMVLAKIPVIYWRARDAIHPLVSEDVGFVIELGFKAQLPKKDPTLAHVISE